MSPTNNNAKSTAPKQSQIGITKPALDKPSALRQNKNATNIQESQNNNVPNFLNEVLKKIDGLVFRFDDFRVTIDQTKTQLNTIENQFLEKMERFDRILANIYTKIEHLEQTQHVPTASLSGQSRFSPELISQAKDQLGIDLTVDLVYNGKNLLALVPFNKNNINIYGTKLIGKLFTKKELSEGTIEPTRTQTPALDPVRINLIKACYMKKLKTIEAFTDNWDSVIKSLRQKCLDAKKYLTKHPEAGDSMDDANETQGVQDSIPSNQTPADQSALDETQIEQQELDINMNSLPPN